MLPSERAGDKGRLLKDDRTVFNVIVDYIYIYDKGGHSRHALEVKPEVLEMMRLVALQRAALMDT